jgi:hypothetical protein
MWQAHEAKVTALTRGGLTSRRKQSKKPVVTTNCEKSAEAIVPRLSPKGQVWTVCR